jgi:hypothetical protein
VVKTWPVMPIASVTLSARLFARAGVVGGAPFVPVARPTAGPQVRRYVPLAYLRGGFR